MKTILIHDWLIEYGGAEKVLEGLVEAFNPVKIYTLFYKEENFKNSIISRCEIETSPLNNRIIRKNYRTLLPIYPLLIENFKIEECDVIISSSHCVAKGIIPSTSQSHFCYCHTPMRFIHDMTYEYLNLHKLDKGLKSLLVKTIFHYLRIWDISSSSRVDYFISNSNFVGRRIKKFYKRDSITIYPPCDVEPFYEEVEKDDYFVFASRLVPYKRADLVIKVFNELKLKLKIIGDGPQYKHLKEMAKENIEFLGFLEKREYKKELKKARALIFPPLEDFGILPVESQALGTPVIAFNKGGTKESVIPPKGDDFSNATGILFNEQSVDSLKGAILFFLENESKFQKSSLIKNANRFSKERFIREIRDFVINEWQKEHSIY